MNKITLATNNGDVGGGEVMMFNLAQSLTELGYNVTIVGPSHPSEVVMLARSRGFSTIELPAQNRIGWMWELRKWRIHNSTSVLWCNGMVPAVATAGLKRRIIHLHQEPKGLLRILEKPARFNSLVTLVPSQSMAKAISQSQVLYNWVQPISSSPKSSYSSGQTVLGFLGRPSIDKGIGVLAKSIEILEQKYPGRFRLLLAGEPRFVSPQQQRSVEASLLPISHLTDRPGWISPSDFFEEVDVFICPSIWPEPFGLVVAEAMSARVPIVVSRVGALPEVVGKDYPYQFTPGDSEELAKLICEIVNDSPRRREELFNRWQNFFSPEAGKQSLNRFMKELNWNNQHL